MPLLHFGLYCILVTLQFLFTYLSICSVYILSTLSRLMRYDLLSNINWLGRSGMTSKAVVWCRFGSNLWFQEFNILLGANFSVIMQLTAHKFSWTRAKLQLSQMRCQVDMRWCTKQYSHKYEKHYWLLITDYFFYIYIFTFIWVQGHFYHLLFV